MTFAEQIAQYLREHGAMTPATGSPEMIRTLTGAFIEDAEALLRKGSPFYPLLFRFGFEACTGKYGMSEHERRIAARYELKKKYGFSVELADACIEAFDGGRAEVIRKTQIPTNKEHNPS